jgi:hypothetical protein
MAGPFDDVSREAAFLVGAGVFLLAVATLVAVETRPLLGIVVVAIPGTVALGLLWAIRSLSIEE